MDARAEVERLGRLYGERVVEPEYDDRLRVPPQDMRAEQAVLGGLMLAPHAWADVSDLVVEADFYRRDHQLIWRAIARLQERGKPFDAVTLGDWFVDAGQAEIVDNGAYLIELANTTPSAANIRAHAEIVRDKSRLRQLIAVGTDLVNAGFQPEGREPLELIGEVQTRLGTLVQNEPCELEDMGPVLNRVYRNLQRRYELQGALDGLSTGLQGLDRMLNGLKGGRFYVLAARPKMGKTTLALNVAEHVALREGGRVAFFSFEMQPEELTERLICSVGGIDHDRLRRGALDDEEWPKVADAMRALRAAPLRVSRPRNSRVESVVAQARRRHARDPLALVVVDYLQLLETKGAENHTLGMTEVSRQMKMLAIDLDVPVIALSQLNRSLESRGDKRPVPSDLRDSGAIEQDADAVVFLYRDEVYNAGSLDKGTTEINVALQRNGPSGMVRVATRLDVCRFDDLADGWVRREPEVGDVVRRGFRRRAGDGRDRAAGDA